MAIKDKQLTKETLSRNITVQEGGSNPKLVLILMIVLAKTSKHRSFQMGLRLESENSFVYYVDNS